jgi:phospholipid N-methyltransferase
LKALEFINQSVARVREVNLSRVFVSSVREGVLSDNQISKPQLPPWLLFARETLRNPRAMGAGWSSTRQLARTIARFVPLTDSGLVVELGGGTGIVTEALLQQGIAPERIVSIEQAASLADYIRQRCPQVRVLKGDALHLCDLLGSDSQRVSTIVSGLPFRSLPPIIGHGIIKQIDKVLPKNGLMIQFTYDLSGRKIFMPHHFKHVAHKFVWRNLPPARVDVYQSEK